MSLPLPEPGPSPDVPTQFLRYLDFYRETVAAKVSGLTETALRSTRLPSGWTPIELVKHLAYMERRWLIWGFLGEPVSDPWGDHRQDRWHVGADESLDDLLNALRQGGRRTRGIVERTDPSALAALGGRFTEDAARPSLTAILFHVLQEYARHTGHLDIVRELIDGRVGE
jgi:Protein of unknown function (DUF664)